MRISTGWIAIGLCAWCLCTVGANASDDIRTLEQLRREAVQAQSDKRADQGKLESDQSAGSTSPSCPDATALDLFKHEIAYQRTGDLDPLKGLQEIRANVWQRGQLTAFYVLAQLKDFVPTARMVYPIANGEMRGAYTCPADEQNWKDCVEKTAGEEASNYAARICTVTVDASTIPAWKPSPNDQAKQRVADELRHEIEAKWPGVQEIVVRDFNLKDNQITTYLKMPDGDYYQGCGFHAKSEPHCEGWHLFGQAPLSSIRSRIFELPYRLK
jgi:hypothetical protein